MAKKHTSHFTHLVAVILMSIALIGTVIWLVVRMGLDLTGAAATVTIGLALVGALYVWAERMSDDKGVENDRTLIVEPILQNYREDHNKKRLLREYDNWAADDHDHYLRVEFLEDVITLLANDRHNTEAGMRLGELDAMCVTDEQRAQVAEFREKVEAKIRDNQAARAAEQGRADA